MGFRAGWGRRWQRIRSSLRAGLKSYARLVAYVRPYRLQLGLSAACLACLTLLGLAIPWSVKDLVDQVVTGRDMARLHRIALALGCIFALRTVFGFAYTYLTAWVGERVVARLRCEVYDHLLSLSLGFFSRQRTGELVSRVSNDVQVIQHAVTSNLVSLVQQVVGAVGIVAVVAVMSWRLTLSMVVAVPGMVLVAQILGRRMRRISRGVQDTLAEASAVAEETLSGIRIVQSFAREEMERERFRLKIDALFRAAMQRTRMNATLGPLISLLMYGGLMLVFWLGGQEVIRGRLTPGELIAFLFYAAMLAGPLSGFAGTYGQVQAALGASDRVFDLLDTRPDIAEQPNAAALPPASGHVVFRDVGFEYDPRMPVLRHVTLEAHPGEMVALVGPSGGGKTTLVHLIPRFYDPGQGCVRIDGHDVRHVTLRSLREQVGIVPQETLLFSDTIAENIRYGRLDATPAEIEAAARAANAHDFITRDLPDGYQTQVGERGVRLSAGQRQRIAIARAILKNPSILILDEATSSLDTESEQLVQEALERLVHPGTASSGRTTFVVAHRLSTITRADRIVVLRQGQVVEQGTHQQLLAREDSLYRRYYALQLQWPADPGEEALSPGSGPSAGPAPSPGDDELLWRQAAAELLPLSEPATLG